LLLAGALTGWLVRGAGTRPAREEGNSASRNPGETNEATGDSPGSAGFVVMKKEQQQAIGLKTAKAGRGTAQDVLPASGVIAPNESQYAYITPRAAGVVRAVYAHVGQNVRAGDLLATIDSPVLGEARLDLYTRLQTLEVARSEADWQQTIYRNTLELLEKLKKEETPEEIHRQFADRAVGGNRERLMTAYAQYRLAIATHERDKELHGQHLITAKQMQQGTADFEVAQATYQSLMDEMGYQAKLAHTRTRQSMQQAEAAVKAARERLKILGVRPDGTEPEVAGGKVVGVRPDGTLPTAKGAVPLGGRPETILPQPGEAAAAVEPPGARPRTPPNPRDKPVSTYSIWAPFDGTILDREMIVPGIAVDTTHRIFTMANLASVWVEANVHEDDFDLLVRNLNGGKVRFRSQAYPGREFEGVVIYSGDLVEEQTRSVKLLARAENSDRSLKPGMFVESEILTPRKTDSVQIPASAVLAEGGRSIVFIRVGPERFRRRDVEAENPRGAMVVIHKGLDGDEEVVVQGSYKLKALAADVAGEEH
jgi:multidrug efflux pump subunit AcrA (membrane-fusion protein)